MFINKIRTKFIFKNTNTNRSKINNISINLLFFKKSINLAFKIVN